MIPSLGEKIRRLRKRRGWSRKALAQASSVSERHLAQLESGRGNVSLVLLARIAAALQVEAYDLLDPAGACTEEQVLIGELVRRLSRADQGRALEKLRNWFQPETGPRNRLALVGFRGAGKSTLGAAVAQKLGMPFVRVGREIERLAGMDTSSIFSLSGEAGYRRLEERALRQVLRDHPRCVIEAGGNLVTNPELLELLLGSCCVVWIAARPEDHMQRVLDQGDFRPMADNDDAMSDLRRILNTRLPYYQQAHAVIHTSGRSPGDCSEELVSLFNRGRSVDRGRSACSDP